MKLRYILTVTVILVAMMFSMNGCGSNTNIIIDNNESNGGEEEDLGGRQYVNGVAFLGHDVETGTHFTLNFKHKTSTDHHPIMGAVLAKTPYVDHSHDDHHYEAMTPIWVGGKQYVMGISSEHTSGKGYYYFIQLIFPSGDFGPVTNEGYWQVHYKTLIALTTPGERVYIYLQEDGNGNQSTTHEVLSGGKLASDNACYIDRPYYYDATTPIPRITKNDTTKHTCFYAEDSDDGNHWIIDCIHDDGTFFSWHNAPDYHPHDKGTWEHGHQVALSYTNGDRTHLFLHRHHLGDGPWKFKNINYVNSTMGSETDSGNWTPDNYYKTMMVFLFEGMDYLIGHNTDKDWFIHHVSSYGRMDERIESGGPWDHYYEHLFPIDFDTSYLSTHNWMERMFNEIEDFGDRKLTQIALPASHDAGMSESTGCQVLGTECNTRTQNVNIDGQLRLGARYFDIRPMIDTDESGSNNWTTGHADKVSVANITSTAGCRGESKDSIVHSLNAFFAEGKHSKELVILKVSHCMTPPGTGYADCTDAQKSKMAYDLADRLGNHIVKGNINLKDATLNEILDKGNIILVFQDVDSHIYSGLFKFVRDYWNSDNYSNTEDFTTMESDQIAKLLNYDGGWSFLLSWTLTLSTSDAILGSKCIRPLAAKAQPRIYEYMYKEVENGNITKKFFPNLLYVDTFNRTTTNAAIYLNRKYDSLEDY